MAKLVKINIGTEEKPEVKEVSTEINVNNKPCDLSLAYPLTIGDHRKIASSGIDIGKISSDFLSQLSLSEYVVKKANPEITTEDFESLTTNEFNRLGKITIALVEESVEAPLDNG